MASSQPTSAQHTIQVDGVTITMPKNPYASQILLMRNLIKTLQNPQQHALLESPTGTGKTLAMLTSALAWQIHIKEQICNEFCDKLIPAFADAQATQRSMKAEAALDPAAATVADAGQPTLFGFSKQEINAVVDIQRQLSLQLRDTAKQNVLAKGLGAYSKWIKHCNSSLPKEEHTQPQSTIPQISSPSKQQHKYPYSKIPQIFYCSRTHSQIKQVANELESTCYRPLMTILGSRHHLCVHPFVRNQSNKNEACNILLEDHKCNYHTKYEEFEKSPITRPGGSHEVFDIEDLAELAENHRACPYYAMRDRAQFADIVFMPYNYVLDPVIREAMHIDLEGNIVILDEAHNIEDICRSSASKEVKLEDLASAAKEMEKLIEKNVPSYPNAGMKKVLEVLESIMRFISDVMAKNPVKAQQGMGRGFAKESDLLLWTSQGKSILEVFLKPLGFGSYEDASKYMTAYNSVIGATMAERKNKEKRLELTEKTAVTIEVFSVILEFMFGNEQAYLEDYRAVITRDDPVDGKRGGRRAAAAPADTSTTLKLWCLNPATAFRPLKENCHSVILASGTLSPKQSFKGELDCDFGVELEAPHVVPKQNIRCHIVSQFEGTELLGQYKNFKEPYQDAVGNVVLKYAQHTKFGVLVFCTSYSTLNRLRERWMQTNMLQQLQQHKEVVFEPQGTANKGEFESTLKKFFAANDEYLQQFVKDRSCSTKKTGGILFAVHRGKVSEGLNFPDHHCRLNILVSIPYGSTQDLQLQYKQLWNDKQCSAQRPIKPLSGKIWYEQSAFRAFNQGVGRCIRHKNDYSAIVLLDIRFTYQTSINLLSKWIRDSNPLNAKTFDESLADFTTFFIKIEASPPVSFEDLLRKVGQVEELMDEEIISSSQSPIGASVLASQGFFDQVPNASSGPYAASAQSSSIGAKASTSAASPSGKKESGQRKRKQQATPPKLQPGIKEAFSRAQLVQAQNASYAVATEAMSSSDLVPSSQQPTDSVAIPEHSQVVVPSQQQPEPVATALQPSVHDATMQAAPASNMFGFNCVECGNAIVRYDDSQADVPLLESTLALGKVPVLVAIAKNSGAEAANSTFVRYFTVTDPACLDSALVGFFQQDAVAQLSLVRPWGPQGSAFYAPDIHNSQSLASGSFFLGYYPEDGFGYNVVRCPRCFRTVGFKIVASGRNTAEHCAAIGTCALFAGSLRSTVEGSATAPIEIDQDSQDVVLVQAPAGTIEQASSALAAIEGTEGNDSTAGESKPSAASAATTSSNSDSIIVSQNVVKKRKREEEAQEDQTAPAASSSAPGPVFVSATSLFGRAFDPKKDIDANKRRKR